MKLNKRLPVLILCALLAAMTMVFKRFAIFNIDWLRFSLENTPILMAGVFFGPVAGFATGMVGDILGCFYCGYAINPIITLGAALVGGISGLFYKKLLPMTPDLPRLIVSVYVAHMIGNMLVKSVGLYLWMGYSIPLLVWRIPTYLIIGAVEIVVLQLLLSNRTLKKQLQKMNGK